MPIEIGTKIRGFDQEEFHALDRRIMGVAFDVHNESGRLLEESLYKNEIAARCVDLGFARVEREVRIRVSHNSFFKDYFIDLLLCQGILLEVKTTECLVAAHRAQALNYLLLAGLRHGRLLNFRTERVEHEFVSTTLDYDEQRRFTITGNDWKEPDKRSRDLKNTILGLLSDWGSFLEISLYREAMVHLLGGVETISRPVEIIRGGRCVGTQRLQLLNEDTAFVLTAKYNDSGSMRNHLQRLLAHTKLTCLHWINLNRHTLELTTLTN